MYYILIFSKGQKRLIIIAIIISFHCFIKNKIAWCKNCVPMHRATISIFFCVFYLKNVMNIYTLHIIMTMFD